RVPHAFPTPRPSPLTDSAALLPADYAFTAADAGVHVFSVTLASAGTHSLGASDTVTATIAGLESGITVSTAAASTLLVAGIPSPIAADRTSRRTKSCY